MSSRDKCIKCMKVVKEGIQCFQCECQYHLKCANVTDELFEAVHPIRNFLWVCDGCLKMTHNIKSLTKSIDGYRSDVNTGFDKVNEKTNSIKLEFEELKKSIDLNSSKIDEMSITKGDMNVIFDNVKGELNSTWADIVNREIGKNIDVVGKEVKLVQKTLNDATEAKDREKNLMIFQLKESTDDKESVFKLLRFLSGDTLKDSDVLKFFRLGKKVEGLTRPVLVKFENNIVKELILRSSHKLKTNSELNMVRVSHDLTVEQRSQLKELVGEAKTKEVECKDGFLFRVRGAVGKWRIVKFRK